MVDFTKLKAAIAATGPDMTKTSGGGIELPAAGPTLLRLISYIELGKFKGTFQGKPKTNNKVALQFELSGKRHPPIVTEDGRSIPRVITIKENLSLNEKARFFKLFQRLNYEGSAKHIVELLGKPYKGTVFHREYEPANGGEKRSVAELSNKIDGYVIQAPRTAVVDEDGQETGEFRVVTVAPQINPERVFVWDYADLDQWNSLFIEGEYEERKNDKGEVTAKARSKNVWQETIMSSLNFKESPMYALLLAAGAKLDIPEVGVDDDEEAEEGEPNPVVKAVIAATPTGQDADDALNGVA